MLLLYLTVVAAEPVATLGALGQGALVAARPPLYGTLLEDEQTDTTQGSALTRWELFLSVVKHVITPN